MGILLLIFWLVLTGNLHPFNLLEGVFLAALVTFLSHVLLSGLWEELRLGIRGIWRFWVCLARLTVDIFKANTDVGERVLDPKLPISPAVVKFKTSLKGVLPKVMLAGFITLRPGTLAVDFEGDIIHVHCLADSFAKELMEREAEKAVLWIFEEER